MNVLLLCNNIGGLLSFRLEVLKAIIEKGNKVYISAPSVDLYSELINLGCIFLPTEFSRKGTNPFQDLKLLFNYIKLIRKVKPDVILSYTIKPNIYGGIASSVLGVPIIANITGLGLAVENPGWLQKLTIKLYQVGLRKAKCIFFQNSFNQEFFYKRIFHPKKSVLIPGSGVNLNKYVFLSYPDEKELQFLFIGRILKEKGIEEYIYVATEIKKQYPNFKFHIIGEFDDFSYQPIIADFHKKGIVIYHGAQKDVRPFLSQSCCTIHPSYYPEGMSNVCLETQSTGRPVITTDRVGCKDTVEDGVTGFIVKQRDKEELLEAVRKFISLSHSEKIEMGLNARKRMEEKFDRNIVVDAYLKEIYSV